MHSETEPARRYECGLESCRYVLGMCADPVGLGMYLLIWCDANELYRVRIFGVCCNMNSILLMVVF